MFVTMNSKGQVRQLAFGEAMVPTQGEQKDNSLSNPNAQAAALLQQNWKDEKTANEQAKAEEKQIKAAQKDAAQKRNEAALAAQRLKDLGVERRGYDPLMHMALSQTLTGADAMNYRMGLSGCPMSADGSSRVNGTSGGYGRETYLGYRPSRKVGLGSLWTDFRDTATSAVQTAAESRLVAEVNNIINPPPTKEEQYNAQLAAYMASHPEAQASQAFPVPLAPSMVPAAGFSLSSISMPVKAGVGLAVAAMVIFTFMRRGK